MSVVVVGRGHLHSMISPPGPSRLLVGHHLCSARPRVGSFSRKLSGPAARRIMAMASADSQAEEPRLCRRCKSYFKASENHDRACQYHPAIYTGGEMGKAVGFCRTSAEPEDQLRAVHGRTGIIRFWDCCGNEDANASGCEFAKHVTFDDEEDVFYMS